MSEAPNLLPCPFCRGEAWLIDYEAKHGGMPARSRCPQCKSCGCSLGYYPTGAKAIAAWNRRADLVPAPSVSVKPLEWRDYDNPVFAGPDVAIADVPFNHRYQVQRDPWAATFMAFLHPRIPITSSTLWWESKGHETLEAAKAAAQADYEARIMAAIQIAPAPPAQIGGDHD